MTQINDTASSIHYALTATRRVERKRFGLFECVFVSLAGLAVTFLVIAHEIPTAMQLTVMQ